MFNIKDCICVSYKIKLANDRLHNLSVFLQMLKYNPSLQPGFGRRKKKKEVRFFHWKYSQKFAS